jgi:hypothetical protein
VGLNLSSYGTFVGSCDRAEYIEVMDATPGFLVESLRIRAHHNMVNEATLRVQLNLIELNLSTDQRTFLGFGRLVIPTTGARYSPLDDGILRPSRDPWHANHDLEAAFLRLSLRRWVRSIRRPRGLEISGNSSEVVVHFSFIMSFEETTHR